ncbi:flagellar motor stator protein MotA [Rickettsia endosymbiont of Cardiosporidium cionae]|uniref:flagellar motor stator protein MotA n=1 Tax=Rickettsia endosymbiont of Cardiosporidium cionae TaxID=2777155 RepID=UPI0018959F81|nr:flagellar motor stator protein MotA [Rickettsia endosymbiont of Cardiosporidium cionae]KAF8818497.1 Motility protein A [Rickettsia endosymbiont of Cardiosporidium cionae]
MLFLVGVITVFGSVIFGYTMHNGDLLLLWQPNEIIIILGSGIGSVLIANPMHHLFQAIKSFWYLFKGKPYTKDDYMHLLKMFFNIFKIMNAKGAATIESYIENPSESELFKYFITSKNKMKIISFIVDNLRIITLGIKDLHQLTEIIEGEIAIYHKNVHVPKNLFQSLADSLPALGIVAAVLGVITTMKNIAEPPEVLGSLVAAALVGTFMGVLLSYGLFFPIAHYLGTYAYYEMIFIECIKTGFLSYASGHPPIIIIEIMRKNIPNTLRPSFYELEEYMFK